MTDVNTGNGPFPTTAQVAEGSYALRKSSTADATARAWYFFGDEKRFYLCIAWHASYLTQFGIYAFGTIPSFKAGDGHNTIINFDNSNAGANVGVNNFFTSLSAAVATTQATKYMARAYNQAGPAAVACGSMGDYAMSAYIGSAGMVYPSSVDNGLYVSPVAINETSFIRGMWPGIFQPLHNSPLTTGGQVSDIVGLTGRTLQAVLSCYGTTNAQVLFDITGPWD
jgi:hypothetical protein